MTERRAMFFDPEWLNTEKETDPDFEGSLSEKLGFDRELCPTCKAHLHGLGRALMVRV